MLCTTLVRETQTRHVPYGSMFTRFRLLESEYTLTTDLHNDRRVSPS